MAQRPQTPQSWPQRPKSWPQRPQSWPQRPQFWPQGPQFWPQGPQFWPQRPQFWPRRCSMVTEHRRSVPLLWPFRKYGFGVPWSPLNNGIYFLIISFLLLNDDLHRHSGVLDLRLAQLAQQLRSLNQ